MRTALEQERQRLLNHKMIADTLTNAYTMLDAEEFRALQCSLSHE